MAHKVRKNPFVPFEYVLKAERDTELSVDQNVAKFTLRGLSGMEMFDVHAGASYSDTKDKKDKKDSKPSMQVAWSAGSVRAALLYGLVSWTGVVSDEDGMPVTDKAVLIDGLDFVSAAELFSEIMNHSDVTEDFRKNS